ncbi:hypothetical protein MA9V1_009 [Chryseobacterium phage MA9V-1]|nr:hypothetical protein MA9V1_009 [Chryseobacterium phage MA9V-1]
MAGGFNTDNSAVNTAILSSIFDLSKAQKVLAAAVFGFTKTFNLIDTDQYKGVDAETKETMKQLNETTTSLNAKLAELEKSSKKKDKDENDTMRNMATVATVFGSDKDKSKRFNDTIKEFDKFVKNTAQNKQAAAVFEGLASFTEKFNNVDFMAAGKGLGMIAVGLTAIGLSLYALSYMVTPSGFLYAAAIMGGTIAFAKQMKNVDTNQLDMAAASMSKIATSLLLTSTALAVMSLLPKGSVASALVTYVALATTIAFTTAILNKSGNRIRGRNNGAAEGPVIIAASLGVLALSIWAWHKLIPDPSVALVPILVITGFALAMAVVNAIPGRGGLQGAAKGLLFTSMSIVVLAAAIVIWDDLKPTQIAKPILAIVGLALGLALMDRVSKGGDIKRSAIGLIIATAAVASLAIAIKMWDILGIDEEMIALPGLAILGLMGSLMLMSRFGGTQMIAAAGSIIMTSVAIGLMAFAIMMWKPIDTDLMTQVGIFMVGIGAGIALLGQVGPQALMAAGALLITGFAMKQMGEGLALMGKASVDQLVQSGLFIAGLGSVLALLGLAPWAILGAVSLGLGGLALVKVGEGMQAMQKAGLSNRQVDGMIYAVESLAQLFKDVGGPIDTPRILLGAATVGSIAIATLAIANTLKVLSQTRLTEEQMKSTANGIGFFIQSMVDVFKDYQGDFDDVEDGIESLADLGTLITGIADGMVKMGQLTFTEYAVRDGKIVPVSTRSFKPSDFKRVGDGMSILISALTEPLANVGKTANWFSSGDVGRGIKAVKDLGNLVKGIADGVAGMAELQFTEYEVVDGKLVPVKTRKFGPNDFKKVGNNISALLGAITSPLAAIGKGSSWLIDSDVEKGIKALKDLATNVINPLSRMTDFITKSNMTVDRSKEFSLAFQILVGGIGSALDRIGGQDYEDANKNIGEFVGHVEALVSKVDPLERMHQNFKGIAGSLSQINNELSGDKLKRVLEVQAAVNDLASQKLQDNFKAVLLLIERDLNPMLMQMNMHLGNMAMNSAQAMGGYGQQPNSFAQGGGYDYNASNPLLNQLNQPATPNAATADDINALGTRIIDAFQDISLQLKKK